MVTSLMTIMDLFTLSPVCNGIYCFIYLDMDINVSFFKTSTQLVLKVSFSVYFNMQCHPQSIVGTINTLHCVQHYLTQKRTLSVICVSLRR